MYLGVSYVLFAQETVIEIEVIERNPPPQLTDEFDHKDWVSAVHINNKL